MSRPKTSAHAKYSASVSIVSMFLLKSHGDRSEVAMEYDSNHLVIENGL